MQKGFGWSNGVIVELLTKYGGDLSLSNSAVSTGDDAFSK